MKKLFFILFLIPTNAFAGSIMLGKMVTPQGLIVSYTVNYDDVTDLITSISYVNQTNFNAELKLSNYGTLVNAIIAFPKNSSGSALLNGSSGPVHITDLINGNFDSFKGSFRWPS